MNKRVYTTANGKQINIDALIAQNENTIAIGNMKVNARGDQLGAGGKIETPREKLMNEYYKLNTPVAVDKPQQPRKPEKKDLTDEWVEPVVMQEEQENSSEADKQPPAPEKPKLRGSLADSLSKNKPQEKEQPKKTGPSRI